MLDRDLTKMRDISTMRQRVKLDTSRRIADMPYSGSEYYYVGAVYNGCPVVLGAFISEEQAKEQARLKLPTADYKVIPLKTRDMRIATKKVKYILLHGDNAEIVMHRARHVLDAPDDDYYEGD